MATIKITKQYFEKFTNNFGDKKINILGKTGYSVSNIGFGGYRITNTDQNMICMKIQDPDDLK